MKDRVNYFDLAKGIGIILVVLGHMENIDAPIRIWIASFHMPLFFVISGMLIALKGEDGVIHHSDGNSCSLTYMGALGMKGLIKKKAKGILIPYLWFSLIYIPIDIMNLFINNVDEHTFIQNILDSATFSGISVMWFLPALFIAEVTALFLLEKINILLKKIRKSNFPLFHEDYKVFTILVSLGLSIGFYYMWDALRPIYESNTENFAICTLLGIVRVFARGISMSFHVLIGYFIYGKMTTIDAVIGSHLYEKAEKKKKPNNVVVSNSLEGKIINAFRKDPSDTRGFSLAAGIIFTVINASLCMKNEVVDNHFLIFSNLPMYYVCAILGSLGIILICKGFDNIKPINFLGKNSLIIMATHLQCYLLYAGILVAIAIDAYVTRAKSYVYMFNSVLFTMLFETIVILVINKFFPFIVGKGSIKDLFRKRTINDK